MVKPSKPSFIRRGYICADLGICRTKLWKMIKTGEYPPPIELAENMEAWPLSIHEKWKAEKMGEAA